MVQTPAATAAVRSISRREIRVDIVAGPGLDAGRNEVSCITGLHDLSPVGWINRAGMSEERHIVRQVGAHRQFVQRGGRCRRDRDRDACQAEG